MTQHVSEAIWLWCHKAACYNHSAYHCPGDSQATPADVAAAMGIKNAIMVVYADEPKPPFEPFAAQFSGMNKVIWSIIGDGASKRNDTDSDLEPVIRLKKTLPNLQAGIMDDFFGHGRDNLDQVRRYADLLHAAGLKLWVVLYGHQLATPNLKEHLKLCDVINFWTWCAEELPLLEQRLQTVHELAPDKQIALGCYMWDFGGKKPIPVKDMEFQCNLALQKYESGLISDIVLLGSPLWGMDIEAVRWSSNWVKKLA